MGVGTLSWIDVLYRLLKIVCLGWLKGWTLINIPPNMVSPQCTYGLDLLEYIEILVPAVVSDGLGIEPLVY